MPAPLDEFPIHQAPLSMARVASSDRNFYDRSYFNAHNQDGGIFWSAVSGSTPHTRRSRCSGSMTSMR